MAEESAKRGRGRPRNDPPCRRVEVYLSEEQVRLLRTWGRGDVSAGLRWLIQQAAGLVTREVESDRGSC